MASTRIFAARFSSFEAPAHWAELGNVGLIDEAAQAPRGSAAGNESWGDPPRDLAELAAEHRSLILAEHPKAELLADGPFKSQRFVVAHRSLYSLPTADGAMLLHKDDPIVPLLKQRGEPYYAMDENPTAENIARLIFEAAHEKGLPVIDVRLWETPHCCARYRPQHLADGS